MAMIRCKSVIISILGASAMALPLLSASQVEKFPAKPIRMLIGYPAGGSSDLIARRLAIQLSKEIGQPITIDNRPGAATVIAAEAAANAAADGYTLLFSEVSSHAINATLYPKLPFDPIRSFTPVGMVAYLPMVLVVKADSGPSNLTQMTTALRSKQGNYASSGNGSLNHLAGALLASRLGLAATHIPYKGSGPATQALMAGEVDYYFSPLPPMIPFIKSGKVRALAVTSAGRADSIPEIPTLAEVGVSDLQSVVRMGVVGPANLPDEVREKLQAALARSLSAKEVATSFAGMGAVVSPTAGVKDYNEVVAREIAIYGPIVRKAGIKND